MRIVGIGSAVIWCLGVSIVAPLDAASAQVPVSAPPDHVMHPVWSGHNQAVHMADINGMRRIIVGTGGGGIRRTDDANAVTIAWTYADTPNDFTGTVIDIEFVDDMIGFACGRGGRVLRTEDGGLSWNYFGIQVTNPCNEPAVLWSIHPFSESVVVIAGLQVAKYTDTSGSSWIDLEVREPGSALDPYGGCIIDHSELEFYAVTGVGALGQHRVVLAAEWEDGVPCTPYNGAPEHGVVFYSDAADPASNLARIFRMTLDDNDNPNDPGRMVEPWDIAFERGASPTTAVGYVVGGRDTQHGRVYSTADGGMTWTFETDTDQAAYGVSAERSGTEARALVGCYSGLYATLEKDGTWTQMTLPGCVINGPPPSPLGMQTTAAIHAVDSSSPDHYIVCGGFGLVFQTDGYGAGTNCPPSASTWFSATPFHEVDSLYEARLTGVEAVPHAPETVWAVGQFGSMYRSLDGGSTWDFIRFDDNSFPPLSNCPNFPYCTQHPAIVNGHHTTLTAIEFWDPLAGVAVGESGEMLYTEDGGTTWLPGKVVSGDANSVAFTDAAVAGSDEAWAVGSRNGLAEIFYTQTAGKEWYRLPAPTDNSPGQPNLQLSGVVWPQQDAGIVVGWTGDNSGGESVARAYVATFYAPTMTLSWTEVSPVHPPAPPAGENPHRRKLLDIDASLGDMSTSEIYAVGNGGMVLRWDDGAFDVVTIPSKPALQSDLSSVAVSPSGLKVLAGARYDTNLSNEDEHGFLLQFDGAWTRIRSHSDKDLISISLADDSTGYAVGQTDGIGQPPGGDDGSCGYTANEVQSGSFDIPNLADSIILKYDTSVD